MRPNVARGAFGLPVGHDQGHNDENTKGTIFKAPLLINKYTMLWMRRIVLAILILAVFQSIVDAFPTGAGGCSGDGPAVGGPHLTATSILKPSDLASGKIDLSVNGTSLTSGDPSSIRFDADTDLLVEINSYLHSFKGALLRVYSEAGSVTFDPRQNAGEAFACDIYEGVEGITHTNARGKETMNGILRVSKDVEKVKLDVTIVVASNQILSLFLYESFDLHFSSMAVESSTMEPTTASPSQSPLATPTIAPSMTISISPTAAPSKSIETSSPSISSDNTLSPTEEPNPSQTPTIAPSPNPSPSNAIGSAEEPTTGSATSDKPKMRHVVTNIQMDLPNVTDVSIDESLRWESLTTMWFKGYFADNGPIQLTSTKVALKSSVAVQLGNGYEFALRLLYDQELEYEEDESLELTPKELVLLPFQNIEWLEAYALLLSGDPFIANFVDIGDSIRVPVVLGSPEEQTVSRRLTNGLIWMVVAICFSIGMYIGYRLLINNRGGLKLQDMVPDTFSFIGSETSRRFGDASIRSFSPDEVIQIPVEAQESGPRYEVHAPAGKLSIILKSVEGEGIIIEMVSQASPVADLVGVGDRLVGVDEIDVREQSVATIEATLKARRNNTVRKLYLLKKGETDVDGDSI